MGTHIIEKAKEITAPFRHYSRILFSRFNSKSRKRLEQQKKFYSRFVRSGELVFDIGAHNGDKTAVFLEMGAKVVSVEPQERCIAIMKRRFKGKDGLRLVNKGVSDKEGSLELLICDRMNTISTFSQKWKGGRFKDYKWNRKKTVSMTTLDRLLEEHGTPKFCKIDIEGFELNAIKGLSRPVPYISFEFTKEFLNDANLCAEWIMSLGKAKFNCTTGRLKFLFPDWVNWQEVFKKLKGIDNNLLYGEICAKME